MSGQEMFERTDASGTTHLDTTAGRRRRARRRIGVTIALGILLFALFAVSLMVGRTFYGPLDVLGVIAGQTVPGASFTVGELRLPRALLGALTGCAFGMAGAIFQTTLRNPLASPDIIGITWGASAAAVVGIIVLGVSGPALVALALAGAIATAVAILLLSRRGAFSGTRLILIGIGIAAMLQSVVTFLLSRAAAWDLQTAMRWLTGSLNAASWETVWFVGAAFVVLVPVLVAVGRDLPILTLGDDSARALGVAVGPARLVLLLGAVALLAVATAAVGPLAFVAFMSGPIAARLTGPGGNPVVPAGLVGGALVVASDLLAQYAFDTHFPVGVVTGVLGAPFLVWLLIRLNRNGGSL